MKLRKFNSLIIEGLIIIFTITFFTGCAGKQINFATPSGKPEVTINSTDVDKIKSLLINEFVNGGFTLVSESKYNLVFSKQMTGLKAALYQSLLGNSYSSTPVWNARINIITINNKTRLIAQAVIKVTSAFGKEETKNFTNGQAGKELQEKLNLIKQQIEQN